MEQYLKVLKTYKKMPRELEDLLKEKVKPVTFPTGTFIQKQRILCNHIYFIEKGIVRIFEEKKTTQFKKENEFIISYFIGEDSKPNAPGIEALEDVTAWDFTPQIIEDVCERFPQFGLQLTIMMMKDAEVVSKIRRCLGESDSASQLYDYLRSNTPDLLGRVTSNHLASFLGVSEAVFLHMKDSNIRTSMSGKHLRRDHS